MIPTIQGTSENGGFRIAKNGFGIVATTDPGWYGQGIYFTTKKKYVEKYAQKTPSGRIYVISLVIPGNSYPVTEHPLDPTNSFKGKAPKAGYQSHYVIVEPDAEGNGFPFQGDLQSNSPNFNELVIFDGLQALPLYLIYCKDSTPVPASPSTSSNSRGNLANPEFKRNEWISSSGGSESVAD